MMTAPEPDSIVWHTSSYSGGSGDCVQVAPAPDRVLVRDSKDLDGPDLRLPRRLLASLPHHCHPLTPSLRLVELFLM